jgi:NAD-dependent dihydropyrimidine dehydrogenase PreA subunit
MGIPREKIPWQPEVDAEACIGCGDCLETCPNGVFTLSYPDDRAVVANPGNCVVLCDKCAGFCPADAISFPDKEATKKLIGGLLREMKTEGATGAV